MSKLANVVKSTKVKMLSSMAAAAAFIFSVAPHAVFASDTSGTEEEIIEEITKPTTFITGILLAVVAVGGVICMVKGLFFDFIPAIQGHEGMKAIMLGLLETVLGIVMISASALLTLWGWI